MRLIFTLLGFTLLVFIADVHAGDAPKAATKGTTTSWDTVKNGNRRQAM
jgi:hypothetical protein